MEVCEVPSVPQADKTEPLLGDIESFLEQTIRAMPPERLPRGPGRPRVLPALALWAGLLACVLRGFTGQSAVWRLLTDRGLWFFPRFSVGDQAVYNRLESGGTRGLEALFCRIRDVLADRIKPAVTEQLAPFASAVVAADETTLDAIARKLPALRELLPGDDHLLPGKLAGLFDIRRQLWQAIQFIPHPHQNEKVAARGLVATLAKGSLILADLGYFGFPWFDWLTDHEYYWVSRLRAKTSYTLIHCFYQKDEFFDGIVWLGAYRADRAAYAVRLVCFRVGNTTYRYITNVRDPQLLPALTIAQLYARRWDIELAVLLVKEHLKLHLLWSAKTVVIEQQIWAVLIIAQVLQALRLEIAWRAGVDPFEVSIGLLVEYAPRYAAEGRDPVEVFVERGRFLRFIRPSRRTKIEAPSIPEGAMVPLPPDIVLTRQPRYAQRKCDRHAITNST